VNGYIETCDASGKQPPKAYSGHLMLRVAPDVQAAAARALELSGKSLNAWNEAVLRRAAG